MQVTILGSGTAVPSFARFPTGYLVESQGRTVVVDLGPGVLRRLAQVGRGPEHLDAVVLTHFHTDHCADVAALLFALRNPRYAGKALTIAGPVGLCDLVADLTRAWPWLAPRECVVTLRELAAGTVELAGFEVGAVPVLHTAASLAYRFSDGSVRAVAFSGDADECEGLVTVARGCELFVCEAAFPDGQKQPGHLTPSLAAAHAERAGCTTLCLTHFYPECEGHDLLASARTRYSGRVVLAEDLMRFPSA